MKLLFLNNNYFTVRVLIYLGRINVGEILWWMQLITQIS